MATSEVAICNQALGWLGGSLITSIDPVEDSQESKLCAANYENLRDAVLEDAEWTFAIKRAEPAALAATPIYGFDKAFQLPSDCIRVLEVSNASESSTASSATMGGRYNKIEWVREGDQILVLGVERIYIRYIQRIEDTTKFSPAFDQALAARLAMDLAIPLTNSRALQQDMAAMYGEKKALAAATDGMQGRSRKTRADSLTRVR